MTKQRLMGKIRRPSRERIGELAANEYIHLSADELADMEGAIDRTLSMFDTLDKLPQPELPLKYPDRGRARRPTVEEDPYNAFTFKCRVRGAATGKLRGKTVGLKDNIRLAGVPMTNGSRLLADYTPSVDALVVERLLDAGAVIVGKLNMDDFGFAGTSETSAFGCIGNPADPQYSAGGSSGGCGAAVASGDIDLALAVDQGGSGRIPASWCGVVALKPTHGLVPSFGISYLEHTLDCISPTARSVADVALAMEVLAGEDDRDPQWVRGPIVVEEYSKVLKPDLRGLRVGVLAEGVVEGQIEDDVRECFGEAVTLFERGGATVKQISFPTWRHGQAIWNGFAAHAIAVMFESNLEGYGRLGLCDPGWQQAFGDARRARSDGLPPFIKMMTVLGGFLRHDLGSIYFSKGTNLRWKMRRDLDAFFNELDVIVTPTTQHKAFKLLDTIPNMEVMADRAAGMCQNTYPTNVTGNPSLSVPCGLGENGLPVGLQIIGRHFNDAAVLSAGHAFELAIADKRASIRRNASAGSQERGAAPRQFGRQRARDL
jgi:amidase